MRKYRIKMYYDEWGVQWFRPQFRWFFIWFSFLWKNSIVEFTCLIDAQRYIDETIKGKRVTYQRYPYYQEDL